MKVYGETQEVAEQKIKEIQESNPSINDLIGEKQIVYSFCLWYN